MSLLRTGTDAFTFRFPVASTGNFFEMKWLGTVVGNKDGAKVRNGDLALEKKVAFFSVSWTGKAWRYVSWGLAALLGKIFMLFPSTEGTRSYSLSGIKSRINGHHRQSDLKFVAETKKKKQAIDFTKCCFHAIQEHKQDIFRSNFLFVCGCYPHNQNRKPSSSLKQERKRKGLYCSQVESKVTDQTNFLSSLSLWDFFILSF